MKIDQTIFADDPVRQGNCFAACVATYFKKGLHEVPHFMEHGQFIHNGKTKDDEDPDTRHWWTMFVGFALAHGAWIVDLPGLEAVEPGEIAFVAGMSPRGVPHQVLYKGQKLWHDPHPSRAGVDEVFDVFVLGRSQGFNHEPTRS